MHENLRLYGSIDSIRPPCVLKAGRLDLVYENGFLRYVKTGSTELIRMINHAVRDRNWETVPFSIEAENIVQGVDNFSIEYEAKCNKNDVQFKWRCTITGNADSSVEFRLRGKALSGFYKNRIGFTILHPIQPCAGKPCLISHVDGEEEQLLFPQDISGTQPFFNIKSMQWWPDNETKASLHFDGAVFETEDQRNWIDASYKTYCTPLSKPFPVYIQEGEEVNQSVLLTVKFTKPNSVGNEKKLSFKIDRTKKHRFPKVGIPLAPLTHHGSTIQLIRNLNPDFLSFPLAVGKSFDVLKLEHAISICKQVSCKLQLILFFELDFDKTFVNSLVPVKDFIEDVIIIPSYLNCTDATLIDSVVPVLRKHLAGVNIGGGTDAFFAELNRARPPVDKLDFLTFSVNPQVHAFDLASMTETLQVHKDVVETCRGFAADKGIQVGPVTLRMRWNPNATSQLEDQKDDELPRYADTRQLSLFGAGWTLGSFKYLAESNVQAIRYFQTCGWIGLLSHDHEKWPEHFEVPSGYIYPVYFLLKELLRHKNKSIVTVTSSNPLIFDGVGFDDGGQLIVIFANFTKHLQRIEFTSIQEQAKSGRGNQTTVRVSAFDPSGFAIPEKKAVLVDDFFELSPFSLAILYIDK